MVLDTLAALSGPSRSSSSDERDARSGRPALERARPPLARGALVPNTSPAIRGANPWARSARVPAGGYAGESSRPRAGTTPAAPPEPTPPTASPGRSASPVPTRFSVRYPLRGRLYL